MQLIKLRDKLDKGILGGAIALSLLPIIGLLSGTAISMGIYGSNFQSFSLAENPQQYWFTIKIELFIAFFCTALAKLEFPLLNAGYQKILHFRQTHKLLAYLTLYLVIPVLVVALCLWLLYLFDL